MAGTAILGSKPRPSVRMMNHKNPGVIIRAASLPARRVYRPTTRRSLETPSSSSPLFDYIVLWISSGVGSSHSARKDPEGWLLSAESSLARPASRVVLGAVWMESLEEPVCEPRRPHGLLRRSQ
ncbi:hypothetical protein Nepgr_023367 [Nepenthes gracilis]|uniref:Uncharacterized protein n=1 Tax=Nepenthes gracilis TaxID=150966 RepID=A0AAD3XZ16_NEPGR|nr:hypothetical protein Nepgr_023367 [Nepenthes gracilis]